MIMATLSCGRVLGERAPHLLLSLQRRRGQTWAYHSEDLFQNSAFLNLGFKVCAPKSQRFLRFLRLRCPSRTPEVARLPRQEKAMLHCDLRVRWKVASDLRFRAAISEPKTPSFCGISGDLAPLTPKSLAIAIVRFWCAKVLQQTGKKKVYTTTVETVLFFFFWV